MIHCAISVRYIIILKSHMYSNQDATGHVRQAAAKMRTTKD